MDEPIIPEPSATKRRPPVATPLVRPSKAVLEGFRSLFAPEDVTGPASECAEARTGTGLEPPVPGPAGGSHTAHLDRTFAFVDVCGFTRYVDRHGTHAAIEVLTRFRAVARDVAARRGVRVGKWMGDGVMLVGTSPAITAAAATELVARFHGTGIDIHVGLAGGEVLLFEGDDYIGRPVNLAARLCDAATEGEILSLLDPDALPDWVEVAGRVTVRIDGVGDVEGVTQLQARADLLGDLASDSAA
jgi:class 3 adenylate cyclase